MHIPLWLWFNFDSGSISGGRSIQGHGNRRHPDRRRGYPGHSHATSGGSDRFRFPGNLPVQRDCVGEPQDGQTRCHRRRGHSCDKSSAGSRVHFRHPQGYDPLVGKAGVWLSGWARQRLAVARAALVRSDQVAESGGRIFEHVRGIAVARAHNRTDDRLSQSCLGRALRPKRRSHLRLLSATPACSTACGAATLPVGSSGRHVATQCLFGNIGPVVVVARHEEQPVVADGPRMSIQGLRRPGVREDVADPAALFRGCRHLFANLPCT